MERAKVGRRAKKNRKKDRLIAGLLVPEKGQTHLKATKNQKQNRFQPEKLYSFALWQILIRTNFSLLIKIGWENNAYFKARGFTTDLQLNKCSWHKNKGIKKINKARDNKQRKKEKEWGVWIFRTPQLTFEQATWLSRATVWVKVDVSISPVCAEHSCIRMDYVNIRSVTFIKSKVWANCSKIKASRIQTC